ATWLEFSYSSGRGEIGKFTRRSRGGGKSGNPAALAGFPNGGGKSRLWTFPRSGFFHGPFYPQILLQSLKLTGSVFIRRIVSMKKLYALLVVSMFLLVVQAGATVIVGQVGSNLPMPTVNYFGAGPQTFGNYTWSSTNASTQGGSVYGYTGGYGFIANGFWDGKLGPMAGVNDSFQVYGVSDTMTFAFATPVSYVGGFFNYVPGGTTPTTLAVYDTSSVLIESY